MMGFEPLAPLDAFGKGALWFTHLRMGLEQMDQCSNDEIVPLQNTQQWEQMNPCAVCDLPLG